MNTAGKTTTVNTTHFFPEFFNDLNIDGFDQRSQFQFGFAGIFSLVLQTSVKQNSAILFLFGY